MRGLLRFLFGSGWSVTWHLFLYCWLLPFWAVASWMFDMVPGAGPQGGEAVLALLLFAVLGMTAVTLINARLYGATLSGSWRRRYLLSAAAAFAACLFLFGPGTITFASEIADASTPGQKRLATLFYAATVAAWYAGNLVALHRYRQFRRA